MLIVIALFIKAYSNDLSYSKSGFAIVIIGSGLLAQAFSDAFPSREDLCIYAAGVSNSGCTDSNEFIRERHRLADALQQAMDVDAFVYFGTCSVADPDALNTPYVQHKLAMEQMVAVHPRNLILRLPQVAGKTPNPHTLLNFLYARIFRSEAFDLWYSAKRNIIDVVDVALIAQQLVANNSMRNRALNVANVISYSMADIVRAMESVIGKPAIYNVVERGSEYQIDTSIIIPILGNAGVDFDHNYLEKIVEKYYKRPV
ncbi:NAD-dependent epimerase/dehydratase family protein [Herminiimonas aquatilis]|uniref:NAD-dependent epimerase/dehydratase family protein n=1 Tax=Herminiimonas aquatilis TaxID=345342 RepID=A0ABW2J9B0_9BURK